MQRLFIGACKLRHGNQKRMCSVFTGKPPQSRFHHGACTGGVYVEHIDVKRRQHFHRLHDRVGYIMKFEVKENAVSPLFDLAHY